MVSTCLLRLEASAAFCWRRQRDHHRRFDKDAKDGCQCRARAEPDKADRNGDGQLEEIRRADQGAGGGDVEGDTPCPRRAIGQEKNAVGSSFPGNGLIFFESRGLDLEILSLFSSVDLLAKNMLSDDCVAASDAYGPF